MIRKPLRGVDLLLNGNSFELSCIREASQSMLARHPKEALWYFHPPVKTGGIKIGKDKRKGGEHRK